MKKKEKIEIALSDLEELKRKQIVNEIKSLKTQRTLSLLTTLGMFFAFLITNGDSISNILSTDSRISVKSKDKIVEELGRFNLEILKNSRYEKIADIKYEDVENNYKVEQGSYKLSLLLNNETMWVDSFSIEANQTKEITLPKLYKEQIKVKIINDSKSILPDSQVKIKVSSSGNGYLWIFEEIEENVFKLQYPPINNYAYNKINAYEIFQFPDQEGLALFSGKESKIEKYITLVTSINDEQHAHDLIQLLKGSFELSTDKGVLRKRKLNWGAASFEINIKQF